MKGRLMAFCAALAFFMVLAGCTQPNPPTQNGTANATQPRQNITPPNLSNVSIIVTPQENLTVGQNYTPPPLPPESQEIVYTHEPNATFAVYFIYVGDAQSRLQGDAVLIRKGDLAILVDAGPAETAGRVVDFLKERGVDNIGVLVSTNGDPQHFGGIRAVSSAYRVQELWWGGNDFNNATYNSTISDVSAKVKRTRVIGRGFNMTLDGMTISALNPLDRQFNDVNNDAVVLRLDDRNFSMVLLSGVQFGAENEMLNHEQSLLRCDVMQAPYYGLGSGTSDIGNFLKTLQPHVVVISGGPDESAVSGGSRDPFRRTLKDDGIPYYENYVNGTLRIVSDGQTYSIGYFTS